MAVRLNKALKELNVGINTVAEFLQKKGLALQDATPNAKITDEQYALLQKEFGEDMKQNAETKQKIQNQKVKEQQEKKERQQAAREEKERLEKERLEKEKEAKKPQLKIVGNINDEYDEDGDHIVERGEDKYIIEGITELDALNKRFGIEFDTEDFETINGFLISKMDKIPDKKERFDITVGDYNFKVLEVDHNMIQQILMTKVEKPDAEEEAAEGVHNTDESDDKDKEEKER